MKKARLAAQSRAQLDERFKEMGPASRYAAPVRGWIKAVREALGMSTAQLARRLGIKAAFPGGTGKIRGEGHHRTGDATARRRGARLHALCIRSCRTNRWKAPSARARARSRRSAGGLSSTWMLLEDQKVPGEKTTKRGSMKSCARKSAAVLGLAI